MTPSPVHESSHHNSEYRAGGFPAEAVLVELYEAATLVDGPNEWIDFSRSAWPPSKHERWAHKKLKKVCCETTSMNFRFWVLNQSLPNANHFWFTQGLNAKWPEAWSFPFTSPKRPMRGYMSPRSTIKIDLRFWEIWSKRTEDRQKLNEDHQMGFRLRAIESRWSQRT
jgi:hypothetical protein